MTTFADKFRTESNRLEGWDYSDPGVYFITICTYNHNNFFGKIIDNKMFLSDKGQIVYEEILKTIEIRKNIIINPWVIMPNHVHLLITIGDVPVETPRGASLHYGHNVTNSPLTEIPPHIGISNKHVAIHSYINHPDYFKKICKKSNQEISKTINQLKSVVTRRINPKTTFFGWQTRFYDIIVKDEKELEIIKIYIKNNPKNWQKDKFYR